MDNPASIAFLALVAVQVLGTVVYLVFAGRLLRRLQVHHSAVHESIGSPQLIANNTPRNNWLFLRWLWSREFEALPDSDSVALARRVRVLLLWLLLGFGAIITMFLALGSTL
jgi:hypothetical protein